MKHFIFLFLVNSSFLFAQQDQNTPKIITREEWGARPAITKETITEADKLKGAGPITEYSDYGIQMPSYKRVIIHNVNMMYEDDKDIKGCGIEQARYLQNYEMDDGDIKADLGYNFIIDRCGNIYEGRSLYYFPSHAGATVEAVTRRDLTKDPDYGSIGVAFIGYSTSSFTAEQVGSAKLLIKYLIECYGINKILTHAEVKTQLEDGSLLDEKLTPKSVYNAMVNPGHGPVCEIIEIRNYFRDNFSIPFDEEQYLMLFE